MRIVRGVAIAVASLVGLVLVAAFVLVVGAERGWLNGPIERYASNVLGRDVTLEGGIHLGLGRDLKLGFGPVTVANPDWAAAPPTMAKVERVEAALRLLPLLNGRVVLPRVVVHAPEAGLLRLADGRTNWSFGPPAIEKPTAPARAPSRGAPWTPQVDSLRIVDLAVGLEDRIGGLHLVGHVPELTASGGGDRPLIVRAQGDVDGRPLVARLDGSPIPTLAADGRPFRLVGRLDLGDAQMAMETALDSLAELGTTRGRLALATGAGTGALLHDLGIGAPQLPPIEVQGTVEPGADGSELDLEAKAAGQTIRARGRIADLAQPLAGFVLTAAAGGDDTAELLAGVGAEVKGKLPPWLVAATLASDGGGIALKEMGARLGRNWLQATGRIDTADPALPAQVDIEGGGPDLRPVLAALGAGERDVPALAFRGHAERADGRVKASIESGLGEDRIVASVDLPEPLGQLARAAVRIDAKGTRLGDYLTLAGVKVQGELPAYSVVAHVAREGAGVRVDALDVRLGDNRIQGAGTLASLTPLDGVDAHLEADLPRLTALLRQLGIAFQSIPDLKLVADASRKDGTNVLALDARFGQDRIRLSGKTRGALETIKAFELTANAQGVNLGQFFPLMGLTEQRVPSYKLDGTVTRNEDLSTALDVAASLGATRLSAKGTIADLPQFQGVRLAVRAQGQNPAEILNLFGLPGIVLPPYDVAGDMRRDGKIISVANLNGRVGDSDLEGKAAVDVTRQPAAVTADLRSERLDFDDLSGLIGVPPEAGPGETASPGQEAKAAQYAASDRLIPDVPIDTKAWRKLDLDVTYRGKRVDAPKLPLRELSMRVTARDGTLVLHPIDAMIADGHVVANVTLDGHREPMRGDFDIKIANLELQKFLAEFGVADYGLGKFTGRMQVMGDGASLRDLASTANGRLGITLEGGQIQGVLVGVSALNIPETLSLLLNRDEAANARKVDIRCMVGDFDVQRGVLKTRTFLLDTPDDKVTLEGDIDLTQENLDLLLHTFPRDATIASARMPISVEGKMKSPIISPAPGKVENRTLGWILSPLAALLPFVELGSADDHPCTGLVSEIRQEAGAPATPTSTGVEADQAAPAPAARRPRAGG